MQTNKKTFKSYMKTSIVKLLWFFCFVIIAYLTLSLPTETSSIFTNIPNIDKVVHFMMFFSLSVIGGIYGIKTNKNYIKWQSINALCIIAIGGAIELIQPYFGRDCSITDFYANTLGSITGVILSKFIYFKIIKKTLK